MIFKMINQKYHKVYNGDLSIGYNGASGPCTADWDFIQEPPVSHSKVPIYAKEDQLYKLQLKVDHLYHQGIVKKPQDLDINLKLVNPIMLVKKEAPRTSLGTRLIQLLRQEQCLLRIS